MRERLFEASDCIVMMLLLSVLIYFSAVFNAFVHEAGHYIALVALGRPAYISVRSFIPIIEIVTTTAPLPIDAASSAVIGFAGGAFAAMMSLIIFVLVNSRIIKSLFSFYVAFNVTYAFTEGLGNIYHCPGAAYVYAIPAAIGIFVFFVYIELNGR